jgi:hypothetical protein
MGVAMIVLTPPYLLLLALGVSPWGEAARVESLHRRVAKFGVQVKAKTKFGDPGTPYWGEVVQVDSTSMTLRHKRWETEEAVNLVLYPVDVLAAGGLHEGAIGADSYLWGDVRKGDTIEVHAIIDKDDGKEYCTEICISRRPGGKLPQSQRMKSDHRYWKETLLNDIDNGEDVTEVDILKAFPPKFDPRTKALRDPGGLPAEYRTKLNAIRDKLDEKAKKENNLKATPPDKK